MTREFVTYNQALALKELGFDEPCIGYYVAQCKVPYFSQAFRWFREKYGLDSWVYRPDEKLNIWGYNTTLHNNVAPFKTYEEAESACLDKLIEICKNK